MAKKQIKRHKCKRAALKKVKREADALPAYLRRSDAGPLLVTGHWARRDVQDEKLDLDPALGVLGPRFTKMAATAEGAKLDRLVGLIKTLHRMALDRRRADQEHVVEVLKCQVQQNLAEAQLKAILGEPQADSHPADYGGPDEPDEDHPA